MPAEVIPVHGGSVPGQPDESVVERLEMLLAQARRGELTGFAYGSVISDGDVQTGWCGAAGTSDKLSTAIMILSHRFGRDQAYGGEP